MALPLTLPDSLQLRILTRAMQMLSSESGSRIVYSTCSLNPTENEAVIAEALAANRVPLGLFGPPLSS